MLVRWIELFLRTAKGELARFAPATAQKNINLETLAALAIPIPPEPELQRIVAEVDRRLSLADAVEHEVSTAVDRGGSQRQSILRRAFEGKLVPQNPNDEPASVLLERVRAARVAEAKPDRRRAQVRRRAP